MCATREAPRTRSRITAPQRAQRAEASGVIVVWWTLCPRSVHLADADATGDLGVTMVGDCGFTTLTFAMGLVVNAIRMMWPAQFKSATADGEQFSAAGAISWPLRSFAA